MSSQHRRRRETWAQFRFAVVGPLLASPPATGELQEAIRALVRQTWRHPTTAADLHLGFSTIERWHLRARKATRDPMAVLARRVRRDIGQQRTLGARLIEALQAQWQAHKPWTYKLHYDNLAVLAAEDPELGPLPSYSTVLRYMKANGLVRRKRQGPIGSPGAQRAEARIDAREVRSFEVEYPNSLWHFDFHAASRPVLLPSGRWHTPWLLGILDDHSRVCCHAQWYLGETVESLVHGLCQAFAKRGIPRSILSDNGDPMIASETVQGFARLAILHSTTLPRSPYQNGCASYCTSSIGSSAGCFGGCKLATSLILMLVLHGGVGAGSLEETLALVVVGVSVQQASASPNLDRAGLHAEALGDLALVDVATSSQPRVAGLESVLASDSGDHH